MPRSVYAFGCGVVDGHAGMRDLLGGKGADLAEMSALGLPVPPGFTLTTEICAHYFQHGRTYPEDLHQQVLAALAGVEQTTGKGFGDPDNPLLVAVRSGAPASMPGMMDSVLNLGLNDRTVLALAAQFGDRRFAYDSYYRFIRAYSEVVLGLDSHLFDDRFDDRDYGAGGPDAEALMDRVEVCKAVVLRSLGAAFPEDPLTQLWAAIGAVFGSWMSRRAVAYRGVFDIPACCGTAVTVQAMVFGNLGPDSAAGVAFTRNPSTGENRMCGEFMINAQGEDVVAGLCTPQPLARADRPATGSAAAMEEVMPKTFCLLDQIGRRLEARYRDMQDIEFTVERGRLYVLQTRTGKRTPAAGARIAVDLAEAGVISRAVALLRTDLDGLNEAMRPTVPADAGHAVIAAGLPASPGAASGAAVFSAREAERRASQGDKVILVRRETSPDDISGMHAAQGVLTARGGMSSHAAVVARGMGRPCVTGARQISVEPGSRRFRVGDVTVRGGDWITIDGSTGTVMLGAVTAYAPALPEEFKILMAWAESVPHLEVRAQADTVEAVAMARGMAVSGCSLLRTEAMFLDSGRIGMAHAAILAGAATTGQGPWHDLLALHRADFEVLFHAMRGLPVAIQLFAGLLSRLRPDDWAPPVSPANGSPGARGRSGQSSDADNSDAPLRRAVTQLQARAIFEAVAAVQAASGETVVPELLLPAVAGEVGWDSLEEMIHRTACAVQRETGTAFRFFAGRTAALPCVGAVAELAKRFGVEANAPGGAVFGLNRGDAEGWCRRLYKHGIVDATDVAEAITAALRSPCEPDNAGDVARMVFCDTAGSSYVACPVARVPLVRLAAARAAISVRN